MIGVDEEAKDDNDENILFCSVYDQDVYKPFALHSQYSNIYIINDDGYDLDIDRHFVSLVPLIFKDEAKEVYNDFLKYGAEKEFLQRDNITELQNAMDGDVREEDSVVNSLAKDLEDEDK